MTWSQRERRWWIASAVLVLSIYASLYFVREPIDFLRAHGLLRPTVGALFGSVALAGAWWLWRRGVATREALVLLGFSGAFGVAVLLAQQPEEKLHFLEYGLLGGLLFHACRERALRLDRGRLSAAGTAMVLAGLAGWGDEGIQGLLPNRYYDVRDIVFNVTGSTIVILALVAGGAARRRHSGSLVVLAALSLTLAGLAGCARPPAPGADWPQFRGSGGVGLSAATGLPERWSADSENVRWRTEIPGRGNSSPIVAAGRVFVTTAIEDGKSVARSVVALGAASGELLWQTTVAEESLEETHRLNSYAAPTPATDGRTVFAYFGATLAAVDRDGEILWRKTIDPDYQELSHYGAASSPVLTSSAVVVARDRETARLGVGWLAAFDRHTGEELWRRRWDDTCCSYATPLILERGGGQEVLFTHAARVTSYDSKTGATLWSQPLKHNQPVTSPAVDGDLLAVFTGADRLRNGAMLRLTGSAAATEVEVLWQTQRMIPQVASPILSGGLLYTVSDNGVMLCYDALTGAVRWRQRLEGAGFRPSLLAGDGKIYALDSYGRASVVAAKPEFELIAENDLGEPGNASPAFGAGCLLLRTDAALFCVERPDGVADHA